MSLSIVVAVNNKGYIGAQDKLLWKDPEDIKRMYELIENRTVILGRKTYNSYPIKGLERLYSLAKNVIVCTNQKGDWRVIIDKDRQRFFTYTKTLKNALKAYPDAYILGGGEIYKQAIETGNVKFWFISRINDDSVGDTKFPIDLGF